jgi:magnesium transporter
VQLLTEADPERLRRLVAEGEFFWLDLASPQETVLEQLPDLIGLDGEAADRALRFGSVPQLRRFRRSLGLVFYGAHGAGTGPTQLQELHLLVSGGWVVTVRERDVAALDELREEISQGGDTDEAGVVARILEALADSFSELTDATDDAIERIERSAAGAYETPTSDPALRREILERRGNLFRVRRTVRRQRDYIERAVEELSDLPGLDSSHDHALRDTAGQMIRVSDRMDDALDRLAAALDLLNSSLSNRLNVITERLTVVATIFLPLTVVTGFFGQNFAWLVNRIDTFGAFLVFGVGIFVVSGVGIYAWVRSRLESEGKRGARTAG